MSRHHLLLLALLVAFGAACGPSAANGADAGVGPDSGPLAMLVVVSGDNQLGDPSGAIAQPFVVKASDPSGKVLKDVAITWTVMDGGGTITPASGMTGSDGTASA